MAGKRATLWIIRGAGLCAMLALFFVTYHQSKACDIGNGNWADLYVFGPVLIGLVVGATFTNRLVGKIACAFGIAIAALVIAFFLVVAGNYGRCYSSGRTSSSLYRLDLRGGRSTS